MVFSDAVVAIALTLLALELPVPHGDTQHELWESFVHLLSRDYLTFTISFLVTAGFWLTHHRFFRRVDRASTGLTRLNMLCLLMIVLLPFASRVLGEDGDFPFGVVFYALTICVTALSYLAMVVYAQRHSLTRVGVPAEVMHSMALSIIIVAAVFLLSVPVGSWIPMPPVTPGSALSSFLASSVRCAGAGRPPAPANPRRSPSSSHPSPDAATFRGATFRGTTTFRGVAAFVGQVPIAASLPHAVPGAD